MWFCGGVHRVCPHAERTVFRDGAHRCQSRKSGGGFQKYESKVHIKEMANAVIYMVTDSVDSYVKKDAALAKKVAAADDQVDDLFLKVRSELVELVRSNQDMAEGALDLMMIAKYLERIGDHAVNVAEWVIYAITGDHMKLA